jgi:hypothetical protein
MHRRWPELLVQSWSNSARLKRAFAHLNRCVAETDEAQDKAIANAYLAKAARQLNKTQRAKELIELARGRCPDHPLVQRIVKEFEMAELKG